MRPRDALWISLCLHAAVLVLGLLVSASPSDGERKPLKTQFERRLDARRTQDDLSRRTQSLEHLRDKLDALGVADDGRARGTPAQTPLEVAEALHRRTLPERAAELARMLNVPEEKAQAMLEAEAQAEFAKGLDAIQQQAQEQVAAVQRFRQRALDGARWAPGSAGSAGAGQGRSRAGQYGSRGPGEALRGDVNESRHYGEMVQAATVDARSLRLGQGRLYGPGGSHANRVYLNRWYWVGPFAGAGEASMSTPMPPEDGVDLDAVYAGKQGAIVRWRYQVFPDYPWVPPAAEGGSIYYGYSEFRLDQPRALWLDFGADDDARVWIDGQLVWASGNGNKPWYFNHFRLLADDIASYNLSETRIRLALSAGRHQILFKLYNSSSATFFSPVLAL